MKRILVTLSGLMILLAACGTSGTPVPSATNTPVQGPQASVAPVATTPPKTETKPTPQIAKPAPISNVVDRNTTNQIEAAIKGYVDAINNFDSQAATSYLSEELAAKRGPDMVLGMAMAKSFNLKVEYIGLVDATRVDNGVIVTYKLKTAGATNTNIYRMVNEKGQWKLAEEIKRDPPTRLAALGETIPLGRVAFMPLEFKFATTASDGKQAQGQFVTLIYSFKNQGKKPISWMSGFSFRIKDDQDREWEPSSVSMYRDYGLEYSMEDVGPGFEGKRLKTFDVPKDTTGLYVLAGIYQEDSFSLDGEAGYLRINVP